MENQTQFFKVSKEQLIKAGMKFLLVLLGGVVTYFETFIPGFLEIISGNELILTILLAVNTSIVDFLRKLLSDENGKLGRVKIN